MSAPNPYKNLPRPHRLYLRIAGKLHIRLWHIAYESTEGSPVFRAHNEHRIEIIGGRTFLRGFIVWADL